MNQIVPATAAPTLMPKKKHRNLAQGVVEGFTTSIQAGTLKPGEKLPTESVIMEMHGVSRTVVREAISHLQAAGLVQTRHGIGTFVLEPQPANLRISSDTVRTIGDVLSILELRISLETECAGLAAQRAKPDDLARMRGALDAIEATRHNGLDSVDADLQFHISVARATGNRYFVDILTQMGSALIPRNRLDSAGIARAEPDAYLSLVNLEHESILEAITRHDAEGARAAMRMHLSNSRERLRRANEAAEANS
jgi:DNA-binding FadR family transcriptional regulator